MTEEFGIGYTFKEWRVMAKPEDRKTKFWSTDSDWLWGKLPMPPSAGDTSRLQQESHGSNTLSGGGGLYEVILLGGGGLWDLPLLGGGGLLDFLLLLLLWWWSIPAELADDWLFW